MSLAASSSHSWKAVLAWPALWAAGTESVEDHAAAELKRRELKRLCVLPSFAQALPNSVFY